MYKQGGMTVRGQRDSLLSGSSLGVVNTREGEKLFKLQNNVGTRTNGSELAMNKCKLEIRRIFLTLSTVRLGNSLLIGARSLTGFKMVLDKFMKRIICCGCLRQQGIGHNDAGCLFQANVPHSKSNNYSFICVFFRAFFSTLGLHFYS